MTRSTPSTPICRPQLPPVMAKNTGALQPDDVRQVATPRPFSPPKTKPPEHMGNYGYALCMFQNFFRDAFIRRGHDLVQHIACMFQPVVCCFATGSPQAMLDKLRTATNVITFFMWYTFFSTYAGRVLLYANVERIR